MNIITLIYLNLSLTSKYKDLTSFYNEWNNFYSLKPQEKSTKDKKVAVYDNALGNYIMNN